MLDFCNYVMSWILWHRAVNWFSCMTYCEQYCDFLLFHLIIRRKRCNIFCIWNLFNPLNAELNGICHMLALLGAHHILHVSRIRVNLLWVANYQKCFDVSLTMHLIITLANDQIDSQILLHLLQSSTCFEQYLAHPQEVKLY